MFKYESVSNTSSVINRSGKTRPSVCLQDSQREGDTTDLAGCEHPDWFVSVFAAGASAVDTETRSLRPLPVHRSHVYWWKPDVWPNGPSA